MPSHYYCWKRGIDAQIKGRDGLLISEKAKLDGEYVKELRKGGMRAFFFDVKLFFETVVSVLKHDGVVEGGTGNIPDMKESWRSRDTKDVSIFTADEAGFEDYGYKKKFYVDKERKVKILITGAGSYIGESFARYVTNHYPNIEIMIIDMVDGSWREFDFSIFDTVFHVAGISHTDVGHASKAERAHYYSINTDLAVETAQKAKAAGVKQFIFMSSMIVYGEDEKIDEHTVPRPVNFYGDSKWKADKGVRKLGSDDFHVVVLRAPMIYGKDSKGNYSILAKIAKLTPIFPGYDNKRSMLYIENLCEFVSLLALSGEAGIYFPQNQEYISTSYMVKVIGDAVERKVIEPRILGSFVRFAMEMPGKIGRLASKAFGSSWYDQKLSQYSGLDYQKISFEESIKRTEGIIFFPQSNNWRKTFLISIITVCHNSEDVINKTISSVLKQTYENIEYIIIDGASSDNTVAIAEKYKLQFKKCGIKYMVISESDKGIYDAMNKGIMYASGMLIGFINAGDWYEKNAVEIVAEEYNRKPFDYFYADINLVRADGSVIVKHSKMDRVVTSRHWNHPSSFATKQLYEDLGRFKCKGIHDDFEFFLRVRKSGKRIRIVNEILANFPTGGTSNAKSAKMCRKRIRDRYRGYLENGYSPFYIIECVGVEVAKYVMS